MRARLVDPSSEAGASLVVTEELVEAIAEVSVHRDLFLAWLVNSLELITTGGNNPIALVAWCNGTAELMFLHVRLSTSIFILTHASVHIVIHAILVNCHLPFPLALF